MDRARREDQSGGKRGSEVARWGWRGKHWVDDLVSRWAVRIPVPAREDVQKEWKGRTSDVVWSVWGSCSCPGEVDVSWVADNQGRGQSPKIRKVEPDSSARRVMMDKNAVQLCEINRHSRFNVAAQDSWNTTPPPTVRRWSPVLTPLRPCVLAFKPSPILPRPDVETLTDFVFDLTWWAPPSIRDTTWLESPRNMTADVGFRKGAEVGASLL
jgi:hypothetical protein